MAHHPPKELLRLLDVHVASVDRAWADFLESHSRLLIHTARAVSNDHDAAMDAYASVVEELRADDFRRLRAFDPDGRAKFTTWLVVVARRLAVEHHRKTYGRSRAKDDEGTSETLEVRRRLVDLLGAHVDLATIPTSGEVQADERVSRREIEAALGEALRALPAADRLLIARRFGDELPVREIARRMGGKSVFYVYRRLKTVLVQLRKALERKGFDGA